MAPEQAMGRPSARSDVFAAGIVLWQMFSGYLPEWPFDWPPPNYTQMKRRVHADMLAVLTVPRTGQPTTASRDRFYLHILNYFCSTFS
jgi:serine/threonine-protein kinase